MCIYIKINFYEITGGKVHTPQNTRQIFLILPHLLKPGRPVRSEHVCSTGIVVLALKPRIHDDAKDYVVQSEVEVGQEGGVAEICAEPAGANDR